MIFLKFPLSLFILLSCFFIQAEENEVNQKELQRGLLDAITRKTARDVKRWLDAGADPNSRIGGWSGRTPLMYVYENIVNWNVDDRRIPQHINRIEIAEVLLEEGADVDATDEEGRTPLFYSNGMSPELTDLFLKRGGNLNARDEYNRSPLHSADEHYSPDVVRLLLEKGIDVKATDVGGFTPLHCINKPEIARAFLQYGADPNAKSKKSEDITVEDYRSFLPGTVPLHCIDDPETVGVLLEAGADPNIQDEDGETPLHYARSFGRAAMLMQAGADPNITDNEGNTPAILQRFPQLLRLSSQQAETSCTYTSESSQITATQCGKSSVCMGDVSCTFKVGIVPNTTQIERKFRVACPSLSNGECPTANDCVMDRSMVEAEAQAESSSPSTAPSSSSESTKATR